MSGHVLHMCMFCSPGIAAPVAWNMGPTVIKTVAHRMAPALMVAAGICNGHRDRVAEEFQRQTGNRLELFPIRSSLGRFYQLTLEEVTVPSGVQEAMLKLYRHELGTWPIGDVDRVRALRMSIFDRVPSDPVPSREARTPADPRRIEELAKRFAPPPKTPKSGVTPASAEKIREFSTVIQAYAAGTTVVKPDINTEVVVRKELPANYGAMKGTTRRPRKKGKKS